MCAPSKLDSRVFVYCNEMIGVRRLFVEQTRKALLCEWLILQDRKDTGGLSVRLLVAGTSRRTSVLLGLAATRIYVSIARHTPTGSNQGTVVAHEDVLDLTLGLLVDV